MGSLWARHLTFNTCSMFVSNKTLYNIVSLMRLTFLQCNADHDSNLFESLIQWFDMCRAIPFDCWRKAQGDS